MAMQLFEVKECINQRVGTSAGWFYSADETQLVFGSHYPGVLDIVCPGNWIGKQVSFLAAGQNSKFCGEVVIPRDPRKEILWKHGFRKKAFVHKEDIDNAGGWDNLIEVICGKMEGSQYGYNEEGVFVNDANMKRALVTSGNEIMVATACGREYNNNRVHMVAYLNPKATMDHIKLWERQYLA